MPKVSGIHFLLERERKIINLTILKVTSKNTKRRLKFIQNVSKDQILLELKDLQEENYIKKSLIKID